VKTEHLVLLRLLRR